VAFVLLKCAYAEALPMLRAVIAVMIRGTPRNSILMPMYRLITQVALLGQWSQIRRPAPG
jgi:hypothetical protein